MMESPSDDYRYFESPVSDYDVKDDEFLEKTEYVLKYIGYYFFASYASISFVRYFSLITKFVTREAPEYDVC